MAAADETSKKSTIREYYEALLIAIIFVNFARIFVFQAFKIPTPSMEDNLKVGDHLIVNKFIYGPPGPLALLGPPEHLCLLRRLRFYRRRLPGRLPKRSLRRQSTVRRGYRPPLDIHAGSSDIFLQAKMLVSVFAGPLQCCSIPRG